MKLGNPWDVFCHAMCQPDDRTTRPTKWTMPLLLTGCGTICMAASFLMPAASIEVLRLSEDEPVKYVEHSGGSLFLMSIILAPLSGLVHPLYWLYSAMNIFLFPLSLAMLVRPSFQYLRRTGYLMLFFACVGFTGIGTTQLRAGWFLWFLAFAFVAAGRFWPLFFGRRDCETFYRSPFNWLPWMPKTPCAGEFGGDVQDGL